MKILRNSGEGGSGLDYSIVLAHAFITRAPAAREQEDTGGEQAALTEPDRSDSERDISIGGVDAAPASLFDGIDYTALGHLHGRQRVSDTIRYSGSPLAFSFSEENHVKGAWVLTLTRDAGGVSASIEPHQLGYHATPKNPVRNPHRAFEQPRV